MRPTIWISPAALIATGVMVAQGTGVQSPASQPGPRTVTPQAYPVEQIQAGAVRFSSECGFCHGRDAAGGESGPDLTRSRLVAEDTRGGQIGPLLRQGRPEQG